MSGKGERVCYKTDDIQIFLNLAFLFETRNISCLRGGLILNVHIYLCNQREFLFVKNKNQTRDIVLFSLRKLSQYPTQPMHYDYELSPVGNWKLRKTHLGFNFLAIHIFQTKIL